MNLEIYAEILKLKKKSTLIIMPTLLIATSLLSAFLNTMGLFFTPHGSSHNHEIIYDNRLSFLGDGFTLLQFFMGISMLCIASTSMSSEYSLGTIKNCFINQPNRKKIVLNKVIALIYYLTSMYIVSVVILVLGTIIFGFLGGMHISSIFSLKSILHTISIINSTYCEQLIYLIAGVLIGNLLVTPATAISIPLIWLVVVELMLTSKIKAIAPYLIGNILSKIADPNNFFTFSKNLLFAGFYLLILSHFAMRSISRRDI